MQVTTITKDERNGLKSWRRLSFHLRQLVETLTKTLQVTTEVMDASVDIVELLVALLLSKVVDPDRLLKLLKERIIAQVEHRAERVICFHRLIAVRQ